MKKLLSGILLVFLFTNTSLICANAEEASENVLSVSGNYMVVSVADEAYVSIGVKTNNADYKLCQQENKNKMNDITQAIKALGIEEKYIKTTEYNSVPIYEYVKTEEYTGIYYNGTYYNKRVLKEYQITHMIRVKLTDVSLVGKLIDITVEKGINELNNVEFSLSDSKQQELYLEALAGASKAAKDKAEVLSKAFDIKTLKIKSITTDNYNYVPYNNYSYKAQGGVYATAPAADSETGNYTSITSGEIQISATVNIVYTY
ncbi:MAG: SIMPL domain-containing protein [Bacillota bacterium]|nr:SIMPL domain-containing protein [Bacillota bacterium]